MSTEVARMAGDIIGSVMVKMVRYLLAPRVTEASSKEESIE